MSNPREDGNKVMERKLSSQSQLALTWRKFKRHRLAQVGMLIVGILLLVTLFAPFFEPYDYNEIRFSKAYVPPQRIHFFDQRGRFHFLPFTYKLERGMNPETYTLKYTENTSKKYRVRFFVHTWKYKLFGVFKSDLHLFGIEKGGTIFLLGTDSQGRDLLSRIIQGGRISILVALLGGFISTVVGSVVGAISGYYSGVMDLLLQRIVELVQCFPQIPLWMALSAAIPRWWPPIYVLYGVVGIFALLSWPTLAREVRGKTLSYRREDSVLAAKALGASDIRIITKHILPRSTSHIIVTATLIIPQLIIAESTLSFLGLGIQPPMVSWGVLLHDAQNLQTLGQHPWIMIPGLFIAITVLGFNFLGDGLRDAADPYAQ